VNGSTNVFQQLVLWKVREDNGGEEGMKNKERERERDLVTPRVEKQLRKQKDAKNKKVIKKCQKLGYY